MNTSDNQGRIQDFKLEEAYFKKLLQAEGGTKIFGVFRVKNHDFTPKKNIFSNFRGGGMHQVCPPLDPPLIIPVSTFIAAINLHRFSDLFQFYDIPVL